MSSSSFVTKLATTWDALFGLRGPAGPGPHGESGFDLATLRVAVDARW